MFYYFFGTTFIYCNIILYIKNLFLCALLLEDWNDVVVTEANVPVTLACSDWPLNGTVQLEWLWKPDGQDTWSLVLSANHRQEFKGGASKIDMRLADAHFRTSGDFSLYFKPRVGDGGRYSCLMAQGERRGRQRVTLLAILTGSLSSLSLPLSLTLSHRLFLGHYLSLSHSSQSVGVIGTVAKCHLVASLPLLHPAS